MLRSAAAMADPTGTWLTQSGDATVKIAACGAGFCGSIVSLKENRDDTNNPDPALRSRSLVGVAIIFDMRESHGAYAGKLYNPRDGRTYSGKLKTIGADKLDLAGCVLGGLICKYEVWTRAQ
jgi:uncharacterized protein (DUF2147 family)